MWFHLDIEIASHFLDSLSGIAVEVLHLVVRMKSATDSCATSKKGKQKEV